MGRVQRINHYLLTCIFSAVNFIKIKHIYKHSHNIAGDYMPPKEPNIKPVLIYNI